MVTRDYVGEYLRRREATRTGPARNARFGRPSSYSLPAAELARHIRHLRRQGWQSWEIRARFDFHGCRWAA